MLASDFSRDYENLQLEIGEENALFFEFFFITALKVWCDTCCVEMEYNQIIDKLSNVS